MMKTIIIQRKSNGRFMVHLRGATEGEFGSLPEAQSYADKLLAEAGGPDSCRITRGPDDDG